MSNELQREFQQESKKVLDLKLKFMMNMNIREWVRIAAEVFHVVRMIF